LRPRRGCIPRNRSRSPSRGTIAVASRQDTPCPALADQFRLTAQLVDDLLGEWHKSGRAAIRRLAQENPKAYLQLMGRVAKHTSRKVGD
jgi:hypothetical protein